MQIGCIRVNHFLVKSHMHFFEEFREKEWDNNEIMALCRESRSRVEELIIMEMPCIIEGYSSCTRWSVLGDPRGHICSCTLNTLHRWITRCGTDVIFKKYPVLRYYVNFVLHNFLRFDLERVTSVNTNSVVMLYLVFDELSYRCIQLESRSQWFRRN